MYQPISFQDGTKGQGAVILLGRAQQAAVLVLAHNKKAKTKTSSHFLERGDANQALHSVLSYAGKLQQQIKTTLGLVD